MRRRGFALGITISVLAVVFLLGLTYSTRAAFHLRNTTRTLASIQSEYLSEGGVQYALAQIHLQLQQRNQQPGFGPPWQWQPFEAELPFDTGSATVTGAPNGGGTFSVTSLGATTRVKHLVELTIDLNGNVVQWEDTVL